MITCDTGRAGHSGLQQCRDVIPTFLWGAAQQLENCGPNDSVFRSLLSQWAALVWEPSNMELLSLSLRPSEETAVAPGWGPAELLIQRRGSARIDFYPGLHSHVQALLNFARDNKLLPSSSSLSKFLHSLPSAGRPRSMAWLPDHLVLSFALPSAICHPRGCPSMAGAHSSPCQQVPRVTSANWPYSPSSRET